MKRDYKIEMTLTEEQSGEVLYQDHWFSVNDMIEDSRKIDNAIKKNEDKAEAEDKEERLSEEFDKKYANGDFDDQMILDDDLPDFKDNWIGEQL